MLIDRMMRCETQWHYGLSGRDKAVCCAQFYGDLRLRRGERGERAKRKKKEWKNVYSGIDYDVLQPTLRG